MKTVNFIDAANSGKRFRRVGYRGWLSADEIVDGITLGYINAQYELEEKTITITESEFDEARLKALRETTTPEVSYATYQIKKELGFNNE